jgi:hypothetical protein
MFSFQRCPTRRTRRSLRVEPLEGRDVPTTFMVTTTDDVVADDRKLSLREAIGRANEHPGPDVVVLGAGVYHIALPDDLAGDNSGGDFDIADPVSIRGRGAGRTAIDGGGQNRIFELIGKVAASFSGLTLRNGVGLTDGGAIRAVDANLRLTGCVVSGNSAVQGAGINADHGDVILVLTTVVGNVARDNGGGLSLGGGALALVHSAVSRNLAGGSGGGIFTVGSATLTDSAVSGNAASGLNACGGGIFAGVSVTLARSAVSDNSARGRAGSVVVAGGGVYAFGAATLTRSIVSGNIADLDGGGVFTTTATLTNSTVSGNAAGRHGGGILAGAATLTDSTVNGNAAGTNGGGVYVDTTATLTNSVLSDNTAAAAGGGLFTSNLATLTGSSVTDNVAGSLGGGLFAFTQATLTRSTVRGNVAAIHGGGIDARAAVTLTACTLSGNRAGAKGGGVFAQTSTVTDSTVSGNSAAIDGGGVWADAATLVNDTITLNSAHRGAGLFHPAPDEAFAVRGTIVAQNLDDFAGAGPDVFGHFDTGGHNLIGDFNGSTGFFLVDPTDQMGFTGSPLDPKLGPLQNNGGPTWTHPLLAGSPAIDHGDNAALDPTGLPLKSDQRGRRRVKDGNGDGRAVSDIGAFEL